ncbi:DNA-binding MarR family transcriptional regulator [Thermosporothrix hazakensis]|jgi:DNA-binding MarR family transcriptional regulator|uniref:DNA-binding MarR family transcriptional regulator n=2 Tax=Thermosporothrix TaxID=768650 RepID=A0A326U0Y0_THEHA|nr:MarR family transcriptional regulator [Thermosporothrix hazakensis]PZW24099.1 DNA-binding MarR family transcriptional regulator [Thermosporothrix hazakensis]BBH87887.1 MarR family transcriptional regulator [Thermosporothrix sp. COM3]
MAKQKLSQKQEAVWTSYQRMRLRLAGQLNQELAQKTGLSEADFEILSLLSQKAEEPVRALALRCGLEWEKSRLSHQLRRMEARGLITRGECPEDNRGTVIRATELGRKLAIEARDCYEQAVQRYVMDVLTPEQLEALGSISERILKQLEKPHRS